MRYRKSINASRGRLHNGRRSMAAEGSYRQLRDHIFNRKHKAERMNCLLLGCTSKSQTMLLTGDQVFKYLVYGGHCHSSHIVYSFHLHSDRDELLFHQKLKIRSWSLLLKFTFGLCCLFLFLFFCDSGSHMSRSAWKSLCGER